MKRNKLVGMFANEDMILNINLLEYKPPCLQAYLLYKCIPFVFLFKHQDFLSKGIGFNGKLKWKDLMESKPIVKLHAI